jgi:methionyl aminopeptidase
MSHPEGRTRPTKLPGANDPCWCGSGRKYKKCHRDEDEAARSAALARPTNRPIRPGVVSPRREVPPGIVRPDYARTGEPGPGFPGDPATRIARARNAGRIAAEVLAETAAAVRPGVTTDELDAICHAACLRRGAYPSPLGYHGYPKSLCTSVNEVIVHGIPDSRPLEDGDIVNLDVTVYVDGMHGDLSATYPVGDVDEESLRLVRVAKECLDLGIGVVRPGALFNEIGRVIEAHARSHGYEVVRAFCGHGLGETFHTELQVDHTFDPRNTRRMTEGELFTIEPMLNQGTWRHVEWPDGWTALTADGRRSAQFEHTVLVTAAGAEILTRLPR